MSFNFQGTGDSGNPTLPNGLGIPSNIGPALKWGALIAGIIASLILLNWLIHVYTDLLWFDHLGFQSVFTTILTTRVLLLLLGAGVFATVAVFNIYLTYRFGRGPEISPVSTETLKALRPLIILGIVLAVSIVSVVFGVLIAGQWETVLTFLNASSFGVNDPQFNKDIGFYVFKLPFYHLIQGWLLGVLVVSMLLTVGMYFLHFTLRGAAFSLTAPLIRHVSVLAILFSLTFAYGYYLDIFDLVFSDGGVVVGATYTDIYARLNGLRILIIVDLSVAALLLFNMFASRGLRLIIGAVILWLVAAVLMQILLPNVVQRVLVNPNELRREMPYIERNIALTRSAFALDQIKEKDYPLAVDGSISLPLILENQETVDNIRLWDHRPFQSILNQVQFHRRYYSFPNADVDRYTVSSNGESRLRQVMLGTRELDPQSLSEVAPNWVNRKLQFTHGYGAVMAPVTEFTTEGRPIFFLQDLPPSGIVKLDRPEVYYGETIENFVIVNSNQQELDYSPVVGEPIYTSYQGQGGVVLRNIFRRIAYAWQFLDPNILISGEINPESRIQYQRNIQNRVAALAPFLTLDKDPYITVTDGRLSWIQDTYTTSDRYPYSTPLILNDTSVNYIRNSVKVSIDAYHGKATFYVIDPDDPIIQTYQKIFPSLFRPIGDMPSELRSHTRYPEDLFEIQSMQYLVYHMTDPTEFFNKEDQWSIPNEFFRGDFMQMEPYFLNMRLPGESQEEFVLLMPFTPANKENMVGWLAARSDGDNYGKLVSFAFPKGVTIFGPSQVEARISNDETIKQFFALVCTGEASCIRGNLLVIPMEGPDGDNQILYAEPLYLQATGLAFPELKKVILADSTNVVMEDTLALAISSLTRMSHTEIAGGLGSITNQGRTAGKLVLEEVLSEISAVLEAMELQFQLLQQTFGDLSKISKDD